ncbi:hypothetical protein HDV63DRAFT_358274 [Trichoderma sp. SZMC 28014]
MTSLHPLKMAHTCINKQKSSSPSVAKPGNFRTASHLSPQSVGVLLTLSTYSNLCISLSSCSALKGPAQKSQWTCVCLSLMKNSEIPWNALSIVTLPLTRLVHPSSVPKRARSLRTFSDVRKPNSSAPPS